MSGGGNGDENLVIACFSCNNKRSCIPYPIFTRNKLWLPENRKMQEKMNRLFSMKAQAENDKQQVYLLELYYDDGEHVDAQNWGIFSSAQAVHVFIAKQFPTALENSDNEPGYIGYHFPEGDPLYDVSFVANSWELQ